MQQFSKLFDSVTILSIPLVLIDENQKRNMKPSKLTCQKRFDVENSNDAYEFSYKTKHFP
jgi:hypothetical protein